MGSRYAYLDNPEILEKLLLFSDGGISKVKFLIPAIHCSSCIWLLENLSTLNSSILGSFVNFVRKEVHITFRDSEISLRQLVELLHTIHYIPEISLNKENKDDYQKSNRRLLMKIGVAGFAFGNIMLLSFPDYLPGGEQIDSFLIRTFGYIAFVLALPVAFYCSTDFYLSAFKSLRKKIINIDLPISLGIIALFLESSWEIFTGAGNGYMDSLAGLLFFMLIGRWYQSKSYQSLSFDRDYRSFFPIAVTRLGKDNEEEYVQIKDLKKNDVILVRNKELIPADSIIIEGEANIDYSFVTGESVPVLKTKDALVYAGGRQSGASLVLRVEKEVAQSYLTQLWNEDRLHSRSGKTMQRVIDRVSHYFTIIILTIATLSGVYWGLTDIGKAVYVFSSVLIVACPCALALTIPFTFGSVIRVFGRNGLYLKNAEVIERLYNIDTVVFDKTGTITHSRTMKAEWKGADLSVDEARWIRSVTRSSTHPSSVTVAESLGNTANSKVENYVEITAQGIEGMVEGKRIRVGAKGFVGGVADPDAGLTTVVHVSIDNQYRGYFSIENDYREGLKSTLAGFEGFDIHLLTGDNDSEKANLMQYFSSEKQLHFRQSPEDKLEYINQLNQSGKKVLMIGDGLNDAGALLSAHVGITIADDIYHFSPACDGILKSDQFGRICDFQKYTRKALRIVYISYTLAFLYNVVGLSFAVMGLLSPVVAAVLMPISSITVVAFTTLAVSLTSRQNRFR
ncbi:MAG: HAD-IC family P-type ATPase [Bacteroidales bacterium]|nr:HAD-IC family P-type ATPase [Bacteroidales bacterium]